jgi:mannose-6-phosphate isomerase
MTRNFPFLLSPAAKDYLWGGRRLNDDFGKNIPVFPLAETWECSTHPDGLSRAASGEQSGQYLRDILTAHPEYLGTHPLTITGGKAELPILIKFIDAKHDLSVQVHPDDEYAMKHENSLGKTEMWYVLDAKKGASLVYGFRQDMDQQRVRTALENGTIGKYLNHVPVHKNDLFFIEAGTVHAIGAGVLIAEIQENSNITYRLYDYDRVGRDGQKRPLHIDKALDVARLTSSAAPRQPMRVLKYNNGCASELLTRCRYFQVERMLLNTEARRMPGFRTESNSFRALLVVEGCGVLFGEGFSLNFFKGDCIFVPADSIDLRLHGRAQILSVSC